MLNAKRGLLVTVALAGLLAAGGGVAAASSPGVLSGNLIQVPVYVPVNNCGNTVNVISLLNPAFGNHCLNKG
jgi:hypothetical protein